MSSFSVLMSVYAKERADYLHESLESVFDQTVAPAEVVLVADGPLTPELDAEVAAQAARHPQLKVVRLPVNGGLGRALDAGLAHCSQPLVARMDSDDVCRPQRFERQLEVFARHPEVDVCGSWISEFSSTPDQPIAARQLPEQHDAIVAFGRRRNPVNHTTVMFRKESVVAAGGYQDYPLFEDYYLWVRMMMRGARFYTVQETLVDVRADEGMIARRGGWRYALTEARLQFLFYGLRYIGVGTLLTNLGIRFTTRLMPPRLRQWLYRHKLRERQQ